MQKFSLFGIVYKRCCGSIAQLGEHLPYKQGVTGSSPVVPTINYATICGNGSVVERCLAKANVASSNLVSRSIFLLRRRYSQVVRHSSAKALSPGSNPGGASNKKRIFVYWQRCVFWMMFACGKWWRLRLMMFAARMMCALRHIGQTSHHCEWNEQHHICKANASYRRRRCIIWWYTRLRLDLLAKMWYNKLTNKSEFYEVYNKNKY